MLEVDSDLLGTASLTLGVLGVLYGLWIPEMNKALAIPMPPHQEDRAPALRQLRSTRTGKALPLALATPTTLLALTPSTVVVLSDTTAQLCRDGLSAVQYYDPRQALFLIVWALLLVLTTVSVAKLVRLGGKISDFKSN